MERLEMSDTTGNEKNSSVPTQDENNFITKIIDYVRDNFAATEYQENMHIGDILKDHYPEMHMMGSDKESLRFHDDRIIVHDRDQDIYAPVNQNGVHIQDHIAILSENALSDMRSSNDDIDASPLQQNAEGVIYSYESINAFPSEAQNLSALNDMGHNVKIEASDILEMGNHLMITGNDHDAIIFQDTGWTLLDSDEYASLGIDNVDGFDTYVHESGAILQVDQIIHTHFDPNGAC